MQAFQIENIRSFMKQLLLQDTFDTFLVSEVSVTTFASFRIDGSLHPEFYSQEEEQALRQTGRAKKDCSGIDARRPGRAPFFCAGSYKLPHQALSLF